MSKYVYDEVASCGELHVIDNFFAQTCRSQHRHCAACSLVVPVRFGHGGTSPSPVPWPTGLV